MVYKKIKIASSLWLTEIRDSDLDDIVTHINDISIYEYTLTIPHPYGIEDAMSFLQGIREFENEHQLQKDWAIRYKKEMIGGIGLLYNHGVDSHKSELGYWLSKDYRGKGWMKKILQKFSIYCFSKRGLVRLEAHVFPDNLASQKVLEGAGYKREGLLEKAFEKDGGYKDAWLWGRVR